MTPPDPVSQIGLALPTILLYEISIILARRIEKTRALAEAAKAKAEADAEAQAAVEGQA